ncbi:hypothetical protein LBBP_02773 [Leptospira borgpetersenii serovar Ballum]|uniref:Uncharacterized protein n=1 Tax=Leptospira borgpetersenii serovar Ballum TaxID=280505 RepID=A0A0S2ITK9_LEPBO|nr:hypothetical protein LBBP_02773 [Leptospira borgpetersenii serovar Ballum]
MSKIFQSTLLIWNTTKLQSENTDLVSYIAWNLSKSVFRLNFSYYDS